jgi:hypothetical protein
MTLMPVDHGYCVPPAASGVIPSPFPIAHVAGAPPRVRRRRIGSVSMPFQAPEWKSRRRAWRSTLRRESRLEVQDHAIRNGNQGR